MCVCVCVSVCVVKVNHGRNLFITRFIKIFDKFLFNNFALRFFIVVLFHDFLSYFQSFF